MTARSAYDLDQLAEAYASDRFSGRAERRDLREKALMRRLIDRLPRGLRSLDIGCGAGRMIDTFPNLELSAALDLSWAMLREARRLRGGARLALADARRLPLCDRVADVCVCIRVLHRLERADRLRILSELARVSSKFALVTIFLGPSLQGFRRKLKRALGGPVGPRRSLARREFENEVAASGWCVEACTPNRRFVSEQWYYLLRRTTIATSARDARTEDEART